MKMKFSIYAVLFFLVTACVSQTEKGQVEETAKPPNVLFISVDDLRPEFGAYGVKQVKSPNLDKLAQEGMVFNKAYCNAPVCGSSRASLLSGLRPTYHRLSKWYAQVNVEMPERITLPEHFKRNGYTTISIGKIFHTGADNEVRAWSETPFRYDHHKTADGSWSDDGWQNYITEENLAIAKTNKGGSAWAWEAPDVSDTAYFDGKYAQKAVEYLRQFKEAETPFFLGLGFLKPHLPFNAPKKYWDLYDRDDIQLANNPFQPKNAPDNAMHNFGELRAYTNIPDEGPLSDSLMRTLIHGYYACVSATDAYIGQVLDALDELGLRENTIVVLWGDHGWNLGEHGLWCKHAQFETSLRTSLLISAPGMVKGAANSIAELVDLYPTLTDLCGLPDAGQPIDGVSLRPILQNPAEKVKDYALSRWLEGVTLIGERYRYTEFHQPDRSLTARMLFDHEMDADENENIAEKPEQTALVEQLSNTLHKKLTENYWLPPVGVYERD